jgi:hypothetical protein
MLDCQFYGVLPSGHHVTNVLFQRCNTLLLFGFAEVSTTRFGAVRLVGGAFRVHPLHVESVAWISERKMF